LYEITGLPYEAMSTTADLDRDVRAALDETIVTRIERERP